MAKLGVASKMNGDWEFLTHCATSAASTRTSGSPEFRPARQGIHYRHPRAVSLRREAVPGYWNGFAVAFCVLRDARQCALLRMSK